MLAVGSSRNSRDGCGESYSMEVEDVFPDFSGDNLLESIDFDNLFDGMDADEDELPALEIMEPDNNDVNIVLSDGTFMFEKDSPHLSDYDHENNCNSITSSQEEEDKVNSGISGINGSSGLTSSCLNNQGDEIVSKRDESAPITKKAGKKSSKNHQGKKKVKVDWTPELHKRFVQAVEQLGVDKAVPSRILELMGIDCLTRHNIASHLQKYRSHRKHLLAREAEAASWTQRRQMYGATTGAGGGGGCKRDITSPWLAPTIGFPPMAHVPHFRPLHVWGHPSIDQSLRHIWPKHLASSPSPPPPLWPPAPQSPQLPTPPDPASFWRSRHQRVPNTLTPRTPCFPVPPAPFAQTRFAAPPVQGISPQTMYKVEPSPGVAQTAPTGQTCPTPPFDFHPSKESIDAAIEDVLSKPWLPLPLGLKPPSADSVVVELNRQGIEKLPTTCA